MPETLPPITTHTAPTPLERSRRVTTQTAFVCAACAVGAAVWALLPVRMAVPTTPELPSSQLTEVTPAPLDLAAFEPPQWNIESAPTEHAAVQPPPPPPPLSVQLIGIVREDDQDKAILYDPESNKVFAVFAGELVHGRKVERVAGRSVSIGSGPTAQVLTLRNGGMP